MRLAAAFTLVVSLVSTHVFAALPTATTTAANNVTVAGAQLNGTVNPGGEATTAWFRLSTVSPGTCNDTFGTRVPGSGGTTIGSGSAALAYSLSTTGLDPGTVYYFCAIAQNASGLGFGAVLTFTTPAQVPVSSTTSATGVTSSSAVLNGEATPRGSATDGYFRYASVNPGACNNTFGARVPTTGGTALGAGNASVAFTQTITGLQAGLTYYYCAIATNGQGTGLGNLLSFTALVTAPTVSTGTASIAVNGLSATLSGSANPNGAATTGWLRISDSNPGACNDAFGTRVPATGGSSLGSGSTVSGFSQSASSLSPGTTYYYCAVAQNSVGTSLGTVQTFTTPSAPTVTLSPETNLLATSVTLNGTALPSTSATTAYFRYATSNPGVCNDSFGTRAPSSGGTSIASGAAVTPFSQSVALTPGTTYFVCAIATNGVGTSFGSLGTFTSPPALPIVTTSTIGPVTGTTAVFNGTGNPRGAATTGWFRYSTINPGTCDDSFGFRVPFAMGSSLGNGNSAVSFTEPVTGLTPGTTYYWCAVGQNSVGLAFGSVFSFTTHDAPVVVTVAATGITGVTATLNGTGDPNLSTTTGWFRFSTTSPGTCNDSFGTREPATGGVGLGAGTAAAPFSRAATLTPGTTYYYCAIASNAVGIGFGAVLSFVTPAAPAVNTVAPTLVTATSATLNGTASPNGSATSAWFRYATTNPGACDDTFGTRAPTSGGASIGAGASTTPYSQGIAGLQPGTQYWVCALALNGVGMSTGVPLAFTTPPTAPIVTTSSAIDLTGSTATLRGSANPRGDATVGFLRYGTTNPGACNDAYGTRVPVTGGTSLGSGNISQSFTQAITGLTPGTTYYFCAGATNGVGTTYGATLSFVTPNVPTVVTEVIAPSGLTGTTAIIEGSAIPSGAATTGYFRYDQVNPGTCNDTFGTRAPTVDGSALGAGTTYVAFSRTISGLTPGGTYYYCALATNLVGMGMGVVRSFTLPAAPVVLTVGATAVTSVSATLNGSANPVGATTSAYFRYATTNPGTCNTSFGAATTTVSVGSGTSPVDFTRPVTGLLPGSTYYYCAIATNSVGTSMGAVLALSAPPLPPTTTTNVAQLVTSNSASLRGSANPNGAPTTGWFRYVASPTSPGACNDTFGFRVPFAAGTSLGSGNTAAAFSEPLTGLSLVTRYYYCAISQNSEGLTFGAMQTFVTLAEVPTVVTEAASAITTTVATMNATATPNGSSSTGWFRYSTTNPGTCNDTFGTRLPATGGTTLGDGTTPVSYSVTPMSLTVGATYYFCAVVSNGIGTSVGAVLTFKTTSTAPTLNTLAATAVGGTGAQLNGSVNPNGDATTGWFRYSTTNPGTCNDTFGTRAPATGGTSVGAGTVAAGFSETLSGLTPGATYYFCALSQNALGTTQGLVLSFTTPQSPTVTTAPATPVTANTATLNATATPNGTQATGWFRYSTTNPVTCDDTFGTRAPSSSGTSLGTGSTPQPFTQALTGLLPGTQYYFCAISSNSVGTGFGDVLSFTTPAAGPSVASAPLSNLLATTVTFNASGNPGGAATTGWFRYATTTPGSCNDSFGTRTPATGGSALGSGTSTVNFSQPVTGLTSGTTYYYCPIAQNSVGTAFGGVQSFITPGVPTVTSVAATLVGSVTATLNGSGNPNRDAATGYFRYGTTNPGTCSDAFGTRGPATGGTALGSGTTTTNFNLALTGLSQGTTYFFCAAATNAVGTTFGAVLSFTTTSAPTPVTLAPNPVTNTTATLNATVNPNGLASTAWFRYWTADPGTCSDAGGSRRPTSGGQALGASSTPQNYNLAVTGLAGGTQYWVCVIAQNSAGTSFGNLISFITPGAPIVTTDAATAVGTNAATLNGNALPNTFATTAWFRYATTNPGACTDSFGTRAPTTGGTSLGSGTVAVPFSQALTGLLSGATYYYCAIAQNSSSTRYGAVLTFSTAAAPTVSTSAATLLADTTVTLNGTSNPRGSPATGWFRYATTSPGTCNDTFGTRFPATGGTDVGAGSAAVAFSEALTGLTPNTTYFACALSANGNGLAVGTVVTFTTRDAPTVVTSAASAVLASTATLNGTGDPNTAAATGWFRYSTTNPTTCDDAFGTRAPTTGGTNLGTGTAAVAFAQALTGLTASTTYYYCAISSNAYGTRFGTVLNFTTGAGPLVTTVAATNVASTTVTLNGSASPNGITSTGFFRYATTNPGTCNDTFGTRSPATGGTNLGAGTTAINYTANLTGLVGGTTYYYCALASNVAGTSVGAVMSFTTQGPPVVTTQAATAVTSSSALLSGLGNPAGGATTGFFRYATTSPGTCNNTFGTRAPASGGIDLGSGFSDQPFTLTAGGLSASTTYYYCALATNAQGTRFGAVLSFTTASGPAVTTLAATAVTGTGATLNGNANPRGLASTGWYRYSASNPGACSDAFGTRVPATGGTDLGSGSAAIAYSETLTGLTPGTTYYFCALASNSAGTSSGGVQTFVTPGPPSLTTAAATGVSSTSATLNGTGTANQSATTGWFRYAETNPGTCDDVFGTRAPASGGASLGSGTTATSYTQVISGLTPGTTYYFCAVGTNANGTRTGTVLSFTTTAAPLVTTAAATLVTAASATLNGTANARLAATTAWFRYALTSPGTCNDTFGTRTPSTGGTNIGSGSTATAFSQALTGLTPGATYYFCAVASNAVGTAVGTVQSFTASALAPTVVTDAAQAVSGMGATLRGAANPGGALTAGYFRYAATNPGVCNDTFGTRAPSTAGTNLGGGTTSVAFSEVISGLSPGVTYYYCAIASNAQGVRFGGLETFLTPNAPLVTTAPATAVTGTSASLNGTANPRGGAATGFFRYATTNPGTCDDSFGTRAPATGGVALGGGMTAQSFTQALTGLDPATTYFYCALATNAVGTGVGAVQQFRTPGAPLVMTSSATVTGQSAVLSGGANPNGASTTAYFRYGTTQPTSCDENFGVRAPFIGGAVVGSGETSVAFTQNIAGLELGVTYWFCAVGENSVGRGAGDVQSFTVAAPIPEVTTVDATELGSRVATLNALVNPNGTTATAWFRYDTSAPAMCDDTFGQRVPAMGGLPAGGGTSDVPVELAITGLRPGTEYFVCAMASNTGGAAYGRVVSFKTATEAPSVRIAPPTTGDTGEVVLNAFGNTKGMTGGKGAFVVYDTLPLICSPGLGRLLPGLGVDLAPTDGEAPFSFTATDLTPGQHYVCATVTTGGGAVTSEILPFTVETMATGCGCTTGSAAGLMPALLGLWLVTRRRRQQR